MSTEKMMLITIDTESDNQWDTGSGQSTENARFLPRFQTACEKFDFKPVYLVDYSMSRDPFLKEYLSERQNRALCEVGMHLHAWDTPPAHPLDESSRGRPYLIEYPDEVMREKLRRLDGTLTEAFGRKCVSHRSGRWAMDERYFRMLAELGYEIDCSVTPGVNWRGKVGAKSGGSDYSAAPRTPYLHPATGILEVPVTIRTLHGTRFSLRGSPKAILKSGRDALLGRKVWMRPSLSRYEDMLRVLDMIDGEPGEGKYIELMMHSSEFMPGGSPYYETPRDIDEMYEQLDALFAAIRSRGYRGITMRDAKDVLINCMER